MQHNTEEHNDGKIQKLTVISTETTEAELIFSAMDYPKFDTRKKNLPII